MTCAWKSEESRNSQLLDEQLQDILVQGSLPGHHVMEGFQAKPGDLMPWHSADAPCQGPAGITVPFMLGLLQPRWYDDRDQMQDLLLISNDDGLCTLLVLGTPQWGLRESNALKPKPSKRPLHVVCMAG